MIWERKDVVDAYFGRDSLTKTEEYFVKKYLTEEMRVLDLGCGTGRVSCNIYDKVAYLKGIDFSQAMVDGFKKKLPEVPVERCSMLDLHEPENYYDAVLIPYNSLDCIVPKSDRMKVLRNVHRILKKDGILIFSSQNNKSALGNFIFFPRPANYILEIKRLFAGVWFADEAYSPSPLFGEEIPLYRGTPSKIISDVKSVGFAFIEMRGGKFGFENPFFNKYFEVWIYYGFRKIGQ